MGQIFRKMANKGLNKVKKEVRKMKDGIDGGREKQRSQEERENITDTD